MPKTARALLQLPPATAAAIEKLGADLAVASTRLIRLASANAIAVHRFDRERGRRIHNISAGTAIRAVTASGAEPELGYPELARIRNTVQSTL